MVFGTYVKRALFLNLKKIKLTLLKIYDRVNLYLREVIILSQIIGIHMVAFRREIQFL